MFGPSVTLTQPCGYEWERARECGVCCSKAMLEMKPRCERCDAPIRDEDVVYICSYECTFCAACAKWFQGRCPNCMEELVHRPRRGALSRVGV